MKSIRLAKGPLIPLFISRSPEGKTGFLGDSFWIVREIYARPYRSDGPSEL